jgi:hypothetical protein
MLLPKSNSKTLVRRFTVADQRSVTSPPLVGTCLTQPKILTSSQGRFYARKKFFD